MKCIHVVGHQNHGKTTLVLALLREFSRYGIRVGTIKHTSHVHELDTPGKDSFRHRHAGANPTAIITRDLIGVYVGRDPDADFYDSLTGIFSGCDLVLVEGHVDGPGTKIEVWRQAIGGVPLAAERGDVAAIISDDPVPLEMPVWPRSDVIAVAKQVWALSSRTPLYQRRDS